MVTLSHRGYWCQGAESNSIDALKLSIESGFGLETDIRDYKGDIVISHDIPDKGSLPLADFFQIYKKFCSDHFLALNVKADGLQKKLKKLLKTYHIVNYYVFDMSIPDGLIYINSNFNVFTRQSEYESCPAYYEESQGVWMDCFLSDWINNDNIQEHLDRGKKVCIVSPELHHRDHLPFWSKLAESDVIDNSSLMICTDFPGKCRRFFNEAD